MDDTNNDSATSTEQEELNTPAPEAAEGNLTSTDEVVDTDSGLAPDDELDTRSLLARAMEGSPAEPQNEVEPTPPVPTDPSAPKAPASWTPAAKEKFSTLPADVQREIAKREGDMSRFVSQNQAAHQIARTFMEIAQPYSETLQKAGYHPVNVTREALGMFHTLISGDKKAKAAVAARLFSEFDIDIDEAGLAIDGALKTKAAPPPVNPEIDRRLQRIEQAVTHSTRQPAEDPRAALNKTVEDFVRDPKNEHINEVQKDMVALLNSGTASTLQEAYDKACWMNPAIREKMAARKDADKARLNAGAATLKNGGERSVAVKPKLNAKSDSTRDILRAAFDAVGGRS